MYDSNTNYKNVYNRQYISIDITILFFDFYLQLTMCYFPQIIV